MESAIIQKNFILFLNTVLEKDIVKTIDARGREQGVNSQPIVRDYIMGIAAAASNEVFKGETRPTDETPVIMGGIALRQISILGHEEDFLNVEI